MKPQWIRAGQEDYERLSEQHSLLAKEAETLRAALAAAEAKLELQGFEYTKALAEAELALGADISALEAKLADANKATLDMINRHRDEVLSLNSKLADERKHADTLAERAKWACEAGSISERARFWSQLEAALKAHAARRAAEVGNG